MTPEVHGRSDAQDLEEVYGGEDAPEVVRLRRENARLRHRLVAMERERDNLVSRYEALLPDGAERERERVTNARTAGGREAGGRRTSGEGTDGSRPGRGSWIAAIRRLLLDRLR